MRAPYATSNPTNKEARKTQKLDRLHHRNWLKYLANKKTCWRLVVSQLTALLNGDLSDLFHVSIFQASDRQMIIHLICLQIDGLVPHLPLNSAIRIRYKHHDVMTYLHIAAAHTDVYSRHRTLF